MRDTYMARFSSSWTDEARRKFRKQPVVIPLEFGDGFM